MNLSCTSKLYNLSKFSKLITNFLRCKMQNLYLVSPSRATNLNSNIHSFIHSTIFTSGSSEEWYLTAHAFTPNLNSYKQKSADGLVEIFNIAKLERFFYLLRNVVKLKYYKEEVVAYSDMRIKQAVLSVMYFSLFQYPFLFPHHENIAEGLKGIA